MFETRFDCFGELRATKANLLCKRRHCSLVERYNFPIFSVNVGFVLVDDYYALTSNKISHDKLLFSVLKNR